jgi:hypothetical protein
MAKRHTSAATPEPITPTISIYQNPDHVAGIVQQAHNKGLLKTENWEQQNESTTGTTGSTGAGADVSVKATVPGVGGASFGLSGGLDQGDSTGRMLGSRSSQNYEFSQAYYLYHVRQILQDRGQLKTVGSRTAADSLAPGDFVEFQATFQPNELGALLDILTPELISAATYYKFRREGVAKFDGYDSFEEVKRFSFANDVTSRVHADLALAIAQAARVDFRSEKTREYYGAIGDANSRVTAVTICDAAHFIVDDEDRILDGYFTVLGKVTSPLTKDVPIFARNKFLDRLKPEAVDDLFQELNNTVSKGAQELEKRTGSADGKDAQDVIDLALPSRIEGYSFQVIPIAIFV